MFIPLYDDNSLRNVRFQYVTVTIIAINVVVWLITGTPAIMDEVGSRAASFSYGYIPAVANGLKTLPPDLVHLPVPATYVTYSFLHGSFMHLAGNMLFIWVFGDNVEDSMGHLRFAFFYLASAAAAAWTHGFFAPDSEGPLIGASGAAAGIIGAYILLHPRIKVWVLAFGRIPLKIPAVFVLGAWILFQVFMLATDTTGNISWAAHVGGFLAGMVMILFLRKPGVGLFDRDMEVIIPDPTSEVPDDAHVSEIKKTSVPEAGRKTSTKWGRQG